MTNRLAVEVESPILGPDGKPFTRLVPVRVDADAPVGTLYLIPAKRDPHWTDEDVARRSAIVKDVRLP